MRAAYLSRALSLVSPAMRASRNSSSLYIVLWNQVGRRFIDHAEDDTFAIYAIRDDNMYCYDIDEDPPTEDDELDDLAMITIDELHKRLRAGHYSWDDSADSDDDDDDDDHEPTGREKRRLTMVSNYGDDEGDGDDDDDQMSDSGDGEEIASKGKDTKRQRVAR